MTYFRQKKEASVVYVMLSYKSHLCLTAISEHRYVWRRANLKKTAQ